MAGILSAARRLPVDLLDFFYPPACLFCNLPPAAQSPVCPECEGHLAHLPAPVCPRCRFFLAPEAGACLWGHETGLSWVWALGLFDDYYRKLIVALKFHGRRDCGRYLGRHLARALAADPRSRDIDLVIPVPLHPARRRERGFNQSEILAGPVAAALGRPQAPHGLRRLRHTKSQTALDADHRRRNVQGAFAPGKAARSAGTVLLIDDVLTTGATLAACARVLHAAGVGRVVAAVPALAELTPVA